MASGGGAPNDESPGPTALGLPQRSDVRQIVVAREQQYRQLYVGGGLPIRNHVVRGLVLVPVRIPWPLRVRNELLWMTWTWSAP